MCVSTCVCVTVCACVQYEVTGVCVVNILHLLHLSLLDYRAVQ